MTVYAIDDLHAEIAYIAYYFHWPLSEILDLEHGERRRYIRQIGTINQHVAGKGGGQGRQGIQA